MASFDPMNLLQVFAPRYNTPSMTYQGGIGLVNLSFHDLWHKQGTNWNTNSFNVFMRRRKNNLDFFSNTDFFQVKAMQLHFSCRPGIFELTGRLQWGCVCCAFCCRPWGDRWCWKFGNGDSLNVGVIVGEFPQFSVEMLFHLAFSGERGACPAPANSRIRPILWCPRLG